MLFLAFMREEFQIKGTNVNVQTPGEVFTDGPDVQSSFSDAKLATHSPNHHILD